jgi:hypothetical protein
MPNREDFAAAHQAAFDCAQASIVLLVVARRANPARIQEQWIASQLGKLAQAVAGAEDAISKVEQELIRAALVTGPVTDRGMTYSSAHRLAFRFASDLGNTIRDIDRRLVPYESCRDGRQSAVDPELVMKYLPDLLEKLAAIPPIDDRRVVSLMAYESARAMEHLESSRAAPTRPVEAHTALPPEADRSGPPDPANRLGTPIRPPIEPAAAGSGGEPRGDRQGAGAATSRSKALPSSGAKQKRPRGPREISKVQKAIVILKFWAKKERESIQVEVIAKEAECSVQNLYKSPEFTRELKAARARRIRRGWKNEGVTDCPDDSTLEVD